MLLLRCGENTLNLDVTVDKSPYASRRPETVTKEMDVPWLHGWGMPPGGTKAPFFCPTPGHLGGAELPAVICDVNYQNDVEPDIQKRVSRIASTSRTTCRTGI